MTLEDPAAWLRVLLAVLATWRISHLLASEDGPAAVVFRLRAWLAATPLGRLMDCFACLSVWVAAVMALFVTLHGLQWLLTTLALSGAAMLLERSAPPPPLIIETAANDGDHPGAST